MRHAIFTALLIATPLSLAAETWEQIDTNPGAYWAANAGGPRLEIRCDGAGGLMMLLFGGEAQLPASVQSEAELPLSVTLSPSGLSRPVFGSWLGPFDNALNGGFPADAAFLDAFARATVLTIVAPDGTQVFATPMDGADGVRFGFGEVCGL